MTTPPEGVERRRHPRRDVDTSVTCRRLGRRDAGEDVVQMVDISQGGARLQGRARLSVGDVVLVRMDTREASLEIKALVVGSTMERSTAGRGRAHVAWTAVSDGARHQLGTLLAALEPVDA